MNTLNFKDGQLQLSQNSKFVGLKLYLNWNVRDGLGFHHTLYNFACHPTPTECQMHMCFLKESQFLCLSRLSGRLFFSPSS